MTTDEKPPPKFTVLRTLNFTQLDRAIMSHLRVYDSSAHGVASKRGYEVRVRMNEKNDLIWEILVPLSSPEPEES